MRKSLFSTTVIASMIFFSFINTSCKKENQSPNDIYMSSGKFSPASITVSAGTTINWINRESVTHSVVSDNKLFSSGNIGKNMNYSHTFSTAGTFPYRCLFHGGMTGTVIVQ
jgi:plastocyanin